ncbi:hypothetical protein BJ912DRAFT_1058148 [Pholiota molesta]|nr:hypothetical protein BJ912DRAFT_1058148 [Pholiota molesta]
MLRPFQWTTLPTIHPRTPYILSLPPARSAPGPAIYPHDPPTPLDEHWGPQYIRGPPAHPLYIPGPTNYSRGPPPAHRTSLVPPPPGAHPRPTIHPRCLAATSAPGPTISPVPLPARGTSGPPQHWGPPYIPGAPPPDQHRGPQYIPSAPPLDQNRGSLYPWFPSPPTGHSWSPPAPVPTVHSPPPLTAAPGAPTVPSGPPPRLWMALQPINTLRIST